MLRQDHLRNTLSEGLSDRGEGRVENNFNLYYRSSIVQVEETAS